MKLLKIDYSNYGVGDLTYFTIFLSTYEPKKRGISHILFISSDRSKREFIYNVEKMIADNYNLELVEDETGDYDKIIEIDFDVTYSLMEMANGALALPALYLGLVGIKEPVMKKGTIALTGKSHTNINLETIKIEGFKIDTPEFGECLLDYCLRMLEYEYIITPNTGSFHLMTLIARAFDLKNKIIVVSSQHCGIIYEDSFRSSHKVIEVNLRHRKNISTKKTNTFGRHVFLVESSEKKVVEAIKRGLTEENTKKFELIQEEEAIKKTIEMKTEYEVLL